MLLFGFAGWSGSGKTTLIEQLIPRLVLQGIRVSLIKHAHHAFEVDHPGKDSYRHRHAGCTEVLVTSGVRWALMHELRGRPEMTMDEALDRLSPCDLALVEGYKRSQLPKLEVHRRSLGRPPLFPVDPRIVGVATDDPESFDAGGLPVFGLDAYDTVATFVLANAIRRAASD